MPIYSDLEVLGIITTICSVFQLLTHFGATENATTLASTTRSESGAAAAAVVAVAVDVIGGGRLVVLAAQSGVASQPAVQPSDLKTERHATLQTPFPMLRHVRRILDRELRRAQLFEAGKGLVCCSLSLSL